jgi:hypothetical protein
MYKEIHAFRRKPLKELTRLDFVVYASYTKRLSILNGLFVACIEIILFPVVSVNATA